MSNHMYPTNMAIAMSLAKQAAEDRIPSAVSAATSGKADKVDGGEAWASKLILRTENMNVGCASDNTADTTAKWFYQTWTRFLVPRPWLTCNYRSWSNVSQALTSPVVLKAGTGTQTIEVYNGSHSAAQTLAYHESRLSAMFPVQLDLMFISTGLFYGADEPAAFLSKIDTFITAFRTVQPKSGIIMVSQNPMITPIGATAIGQHFRRMSSLRSYAASNGFGYLPLLEEFNKNSPSSLIGADGLQPNSAGHTLWSKAAANHLEGLTWQ